jgi:hypothetical protein
MTTASATSGDHWEEQGAAQFGRRAHRHFGRGFVLVDPADQNSPVYVTRLAGAPPELWQEVHLYRPERETILVSQEDGGLSVRRVKIDAQQ